MTNLEFSKVDKKFLEACDLAGLKPSARQASKYRRNMGLAYKTLKLQTKGLSTNKEK